jgi:hypothetical protein
MQKTFIRPSEWKTSTMSADSPMTRQALAETLIERVDELVQAILRTRVSTTPTSVAIRELTARTEALEQAVRAIALEVQKLAGPVNA